jgi:two-component system phosphate regulon sensor histidine kinase PhoR
LFWRIFAAYVALTVASAAIFATVISSRQREVVTSHAERRLYDKAVMLRHAMADVLSGDRAANLAGELRQLASDSGIRLSLIAADGTVLGDSAENPAKMPNHGDRPEIRQALREGFGVSQRSSATVGVRMLYYALRVGPVEKPLGFVRAAMVMQLVDAQVLSVQRLVWFTALAVSAVVLAFTYFVLARITRPLESLTLAAQSIAEGNLKQSVEIKGGDELGMLADAFNSMSLQLATRVEELERQSRQLEERSELLTTVLGGMIEGVFAVDNSENILFANGAARKLLDFRKGEPVGLPMSKIVRNSLILDLVRDALAGRAQQSAVLELTRPAAVVNLLATRLPGRHCPGVVVVLHDVSDLRRLENLRREFVSNVSHELKTPLTSIQAYTETLLAGAIDDPEHNRRFVKRIEEQSDRLHALIIDLLRLARIESGQDVFEVTSLSAGEMVNDCAEAHKAIAESKGVSLVLERPEADIFIRADAEALRTILDNLLDNAIKYTPAGGRVTVRWNSENAWAVVQVQDTGVGIDEDQQSRIFERFYRVDKARSRELGGTGLGLSIVKHLVQVFSGSVGVESQLGRGSSFFVRLPLAETLEGVATSD